MQSVKNIPPKEKTQKSLAPVYLAPVAATPHN